jgi:hypothetical protein
MKIRVLRLSCKLELQEKRASRIEINVIFNDVWAQVKNEVGMVELVTRYKYDEPSRIPSSPAHIPPGAMQNQS